MNVAGLDLSLRCAGVAVVDADRKVFTYSFGRALTGEANERDRAWRNIEIANHVVRIIRQHSVKAVAIEDYAFSRKSSSVHVLAELGGLVKSQLLMACGVRFCPIASNSVRKFLFGSLEKDKNKIRTNLAKMGYDQPKNNDESDALAVALVMDAYSNRRASFSRVHEIQVFDRIDKRMG